MDPKHTPPPVEDEGVPLLVEEMGRRPRARRRARDDRWRRFD
ncbi:hypothetical protein QDR37_08600 [Amnibacterium sp. CER49]|nr:hypothetical protein [Amnibacterium sp. CER49]MDH2444001.1 hypothetical protein [Amnibacterium sp. CER49]